MTTKMAVGRWMALASGFFIPVIAFADMQLIPVWERKQCGTETMACYTFEQAKQLVSVDADCVYKTKAIELQKKSLDDARVALDKAFEINQKLTGSIAVLDQRLTESHEVLQKTTEAYYTAVQRDIFHNAGWIIAVIAVIGVASFAGGFLLASK